MKTFKDLTFKPHGTPGFRTHATMEFPNGYGISVITGEFSYSDDEHPYEVAVLKNGGLCYDTPITDDVIGYLTADDVTNIMKQIQEL